jgi:tetratricopeptide (TPR) repeat protein
MTLDRFEQPGRLSLIVSVIFAATWGMGSEFAGAAQKKKERKVDVAEVEDQKKRPSLEDEEKGPQFKAEDFIAEKNFKGLKKQDEAIVHLKDLLDSMPESDPERAEILFNLAEQYWNKSKYYEQSAYRKQNTCYDLEESGKKGRAKSCKRRMQRMLDESKRLRSETASLYKEIIRNYPQYDKLDKILFYLGNNLQEAGRKQEALKVYRKLLSKYPDTPYAPNVLLAFGEYYFGEKNNPRRALKFYNKVGKFKDSSVYAYSRYKAAWCHYNMGSKDKALDIFIEVVEYAKAHPDQPNASALVDQVRKDIVLTYAEVGSPDKAIPFFKDLTDDNMKEVMKMAERLAIHYADNSKYAYSTKMYRQLIQLDKTSVDTVDYQYEIVRNHTTQNPYNKDTIEELVKLMKLIQLAKKGQFEDYEESEFASTRKRIEKFTRMWATRYHREAQVTKNPSLYKMAYFLYDNYLQTFTGSDNLYQMRFFAGEILYHLEKWEEAAKMYGKVIEMDEEGKYLEESAHARVLAYFKLVNTSEKKANLESPLKYEKKDQAEQVQKKDEQKTSVPEPKEIPELKQKLIRACEQYLTYVSKDSKLGDELVDVRYTMARVYYEHDHLKEAGEIFRQIAFKHSKDDLAVISANLHLDTLNRLDNLDQLHEAVRAYLNKKPIQEEEFLSNARRLDEAIRFKLCRQKSQAEEWKAAAECYVQFYRDFKGSEYVAKALYNAALAYERIKELGKAIQVRVFLLKARPDSDLAPDALFKIGANYHALAVYSRAAEFYEKFVRAFPDKEKKAQEALANASNFRQGLGQYDKAIEDFEKYLDLFGDKDEYAKKAADVAFQIAEIYKKQDKPEKALEQYEEYLDSYEDKGTLDRMLQVHVRIGMYYWSRDYEGYHERALKEFRETLEVYEGLSEEEKKKLTEGRDAAARAKFMLGEDVYQKMADVTVKSSDQEELKERFQKKMKIAKEAQTIYEEVIKFKRPDWAIAALYKIGALYQNFAETVRNSPAPDRLNYRQKELYKGILEDRASRVEKKAVAAYERSLQVAREQSWFNEYSQKAEVRLAKLRPRKYQKPSEMRAEPTHFRSGYSNAGFIQQLEVEDQRVEELGGGESASPSKARNQKQKQENDASDGDEETETPVQVGRRGTPSS